MSNMRFSSLVIRLIANELTTIKKYSNNSRWLCLSNYLSFEGFFGLGCSSICPSGKFPSGYKSTIGIDGGLVCWRGAAGADVWPFVAGRKEKWQDSIYFHWNQTFLLLFIFLFRCRFCFITAFVIFLII